MTFDIHLSNLNRITKPNVGLSKSFERLVLSGPLFRNAPQEIDRSFFSICHAARKTKAESPVYVRYRSADLSSGLGDEGFKGLGKGVAPHTLHIPRARARPGFEPSCAQLYHSCDPASGTFLGYDGRRHACE
jgi:hypothetical protein